MTSSGAETVFAGARLDRVIQSKVLRKKSEEKRREPSMTCPLRFDFLSRLRLPNGRVTGVRAYVDVDGHTGECRVWTQLPWEVVAYPGRLTAEMRIELRSLLPEELRHLELHDLTEARGMKGSAPVGLAGGACVGA